MLAKKEDGNLWWVQRPTMPTDFKLVLRTENLKGYHIRSMRLLLDENGSQFVGGKVAVNDDVLIILYLCAGFALNETLLGEIADLFDAHPFMPFNHAFEDVKLIWLGPSHTSDGVCKPIY